MWVVGVGITTHVALNTLRINIRKRVDALKICEALNPKLSRGAVAAIASTEAQRSGASPSANEDICVSMSE